jgi:RNA processing factor Prp31
MKFEDFLKDDYVKANQEFTIYQLKNLKPTKTPNLDDVAGTDLTQKLLKEAGNLKKLALMRPQTIYLLGSKRWFVSGMRKMEAGHIKNHPDFWKGGMELAKKISIAARKDYGNQ